MQGLLLYSLAAILIFKYKWIICINIAVLGKCVASISSKLLAGQLTESEPGKKKKKNKKKNKKKERKNLKWILLSEKKKRLKKKKERSQFDKTT